MSGCKETANLLRTLLACATDPRDCHLNFHLRESDIAQAIRIAVECIETQESRADVSDRLRAVLIDLSRAAIATNSPEFVAIPVENWQKLIDALAEK